jgi:hypothetical protein
MAQGDFSSEAKVEAEEGKRLHRWESLELAHKSAQAAAAAVVHARRRVNFSQEATGFQV